MKRLKAPIILLIICLFSINFSSCSSEKIIVQTKIDTIKIVPKTLSDSVYMRASAYNNDTIYVYNKVVNTDTVIKFRFIPKTKKLYYYLKPDTIKILRVDTVNVIKVNVNKKEINIFDYFVYVSAGVLLILFLIFLIKLLKK